MSEEAVKAARNAVYAKAIEFGWDAGNLSDETDAMADGALEAARFVGADTARLVEENEKLLSLLRGAVAWIIAVDAQPDEDFPIALAQFEEARAALGGEQS